ncbi:MAG: coenzyme F420-0:L-glutamate ligase [Candidatus Methanoperedens sp.]|nr:coenzyme F420-0:L-glutamate ligase [Candidatus Methanoperedens sp.]MCZ7361185.1 coenzyme F420-0:L-glutamate ligase [Candidatus Methanoperedens sp.]HLB70832.1 coenzyme F420-0:L-glutamate ligase [Candidatus Methanoperedens sp.]
MNAEAITVENIPLIKPGDDIARVIAERAKLEEKDIIIISSTIVSKSENRIFSLDGIKVTGRAETIAKKNSNDPRFVQIVLDESEEVLLDSPFLLVRMKNGSICVNAGIDRSNVEGQENVLLLPEAPDESAGRIRDSLFKLTGKKVSVIITDTNGRAFRIGQTGAAIGITGIKPTRDWRGTKDLFGRVLEVKNEAVVDEIAGFGNFLMGEGNGGTPVVIIRGLNLYHESSGIKELIRPEREDVILRALRSQ